MNWPTVALMGPDIEANHVVSGIGYEREYTSPAVQRQPAGSLQAWLWTRIRQAECSTPAVKIFCFIRHLIWLALDSRIRQS